MLNPSIWNEPDESYERVYAAGNPWTHESQGDCDEVKHRRQLSLPVTAYRSCQKGLRPLLGYNGMLQYEIGDCGHQQNESIERSWNRSKMILAHPCRCNRKQREPEKKVKVRPEDATANVFRRIKHMMVVVPVNSKINKTENVAQKDRQQWFQGSQLDAMRYLQFQHHYCDDDGKYSVAKCFQSVFSHWQNRWTAQAFPAPHPLIANGFLTVT
jgi:hypothetical protein